MKGRFDISNQGAGFELTTKDFGSKGDEPSLLESNAEIATSYSKQQT